MKHKCLLLTIAIVLLVSSTGCTAPTLNNADSIEQVEKIDSVAGLIKKELIDVWNVDFKGVVGAGGIGATADMYQLMRLVVLQIG